MFRMFLPTVRQDTRLDDLLDNKRRLAIVANEIIAQSPMSGSYLPRKNHRPGFLEHASLTRKHHVRFLLRCEIRKCSFRQGTTLPMTWQGRELVC